jgi:hypothetical protein
MAIGTEIEHVQNVISEVLLNEWEAQGHSMGGGVVKSIEYVIKQEENSITLSGMMYPYGSIIAAGTPKNRIPFSGRSGRGGTSKYIQALQSYVQSRMNISDEKKSLSVAFAIAHKQKQEGMPTKGSYAFTKTGKRLEWISEALQKDKVTEAIKGLGYYITSVKFDAMISEWQVEINKSE